MPIKGFKDKTTEEIAHEVQSKKALKLLPQELHRVAYRRLVFLDNASRLSDLQEWRSLRLEKLKGDRKGQLSIRINDQYRICFVWDNNSAYEVEIVDYHK